MVKRYFAAFVIFLVCSMSAVRGQGPSPHPKEVRLQPVIEALLSNLDGASVTVDSRGLVAAYVVQEFQVHTVFKDGAISEHPHAQRGPNRGGFLLKVVIRPEPHYFGSIILSPEGYGLIRHPYWVTQVREIRLPESGEHVWVTLAMGASVDTQLMQELQENIYTHTTSK